MMSFFHVNCCLKLNYLICGSSENTSNNKRKKKFKLQQRSIWNDDCSNSKIINRIEPTPINTDRQYNVNVASIHPIIQQQNSRNKYYYDSSLNSFNESNLYRRSSTILNNGVEIKIVTLRRNNPNERLGLTLCYGVTSKSTTNVYIQQIDKESIAGQHGELQNGDQIIKINNHRVTSRDEAIKLVNGACFIRLQIVRFQFSKPDFPIIYSVPLAEDDSGVILACNTDLETTNDFVNQQSFNKCHILLKNAISLSSFTLNKCSNCHRVQCLSDQFQYRRCLSLNDIRSCRLIGNIVDPPNNFIRSQSLFGTTTDNEQIILKPLPFYPQPQTLACRDDSDSGLVCGRSRSNDSYRLRSRQNRWTLKHFRRRCREQRLREQYQTTDDEPMSELKQGRYWTREQRKEHAIKAKQYRQRAKYFQQYSVNPLSDSATEDFNLLNRIFLRENHQELRQKPYLAYKYGQQSTIERNKLRQIIHKHYLNKIQSQSTTTISISSTIDQPPMVIL